MSRNAVPSKKKVTRHGNLTRNFRGPPRPHFGAILSSLFGEYIQNSDLKYSVLFHETEKKLLHIYLKVLGQILAIFLD
jgi:hypothetical protein